MALTVAMPWKRFHALPLAVGAPWKYFQPLPPVVQSQKKRSNAPICFFDTLEAVPHLFPGCATPFYTKIATVTMSLMQPLLQPLSQQIGQLRIIEVLHQEMGIAMNT